MDKFVGRSAEYNYLEQYYRRSGSQILVLYGGRGIGKTRLLQEFCRGKRNTYYLARSCSGVEQRYQWGQECKAKGLSMERYPSWEALFGAEIFRDGQKHVLVLDEFQHMVKSDENFFGSLCRFVEKEGAENPLLVVLCTSASGWVENSMVDRVGVLTTKISGFLKVRELSFDAIRELFASYSLEDAVSAYAVLGGIPGYWKSFSEKMNARDNIIHNILNRESRLFEEMTVFLEQELREPAVYNTILATLARDCCKLNDIYKHTGFSRAKISVYLKILMELDLVEKVYSYETEGRSNAQKGIYRISNPYVRFYFRYLFPNLSMLQLVSAEEFYEAKVKESFGLFVEETYRKICREQMKKKYPLVSEWLGKSGNLDIVATDNEGHICIAACAYSGELTMQDYEWLLYSAKKAKINPTEIFLFGENGFEESLMQLAEKGTVKLLHLWN